MWITIDRTQKVKMPLFSSVPAGYPFPAIDITQKEIDINHFLVPHPASTFLLRVKDDSMIQAGIVQGDFVIVDRGELHGKEGDIMVLAGRERTENFTLKIIKDNEPHAGLEILGKVVGVFRRVH